MSDANVGCSAGLTTEQVLIRLRTDGANALPSPRRRPGFLRLADQLVGFFALMLWVAGALAVAAGLPQLGAAIFGVIVLNGIFAFAQENRADHAADRLRSLLPRQVTVWRDERPVLVPAADVVVGDLLVLEPGDRIPADALTVRADDLLVDTSLLTGESLPTPVRSGEELFAGTFVVEGGAEAVVTATGGSTRLAEIARLTTATARPATPLAKELHRVVRTIAVIALGVGASFFALAMLIGSTATDGFIFAIGITVALVPEALLPTVTLSLAWGAEQLAKRRVLVRDLEAVETLGSTTFICTDKTGTLTRNEMAVVEAWTPVGMALIEGEGYEPAARVVLSAPEIRSEMTAMGAAAARCSTGYIFQDGETWRPHGDPMEAAVDAFARRLGVDVEQLRRVDAVDARFPFDPRRRRMSIVVGTEVIVKGAPDAVLPLCLNSDGAQEALEALTRKGLRVLAVASRRLADADLRPTTAIAAEVDLVLLGLLALEDPPRADVSDAIERCRRAGVKVAMITGDHPATAAAIALQVGLRSAGDPVLCGDELPADQEVLGALVDRHGVVVARVSPEDKLRIARALRARGHVVAMTGDGVNDGPALHEADIGIAMGASGTDVAREAADLVLLDDHFATIVSGIELGRATYLNVRRFLTYHLTDNVAEVTPFLLWALSGGRFPLALGVLQVLALDIGTDTLSAVALGAEPPGRDLLGGPPVSGRLLNHGVLRRAFARLGPVEALWAVAAFVVSFLAAGWRPGQSFPGGAVAAAASGAAFMAVVFAQSANAFACRSSSRRPGQLGWWTNRLLPPAVAAGIGFALFVLLVPAIADELGQTIPSAAGWVMALAAPAVLLAVDALDKAVRQRRDPRS